MSMSKRKSRSIGKPGLSILIALAMILTWNALDVIPAQAEDLSVSIYGVELQDGKYYEFSGSRYNNNGAMAESDTVPASGNYIYYTNGTMEVRGNVSIYANSGTQTAGTILSIAHGTLTLTGDGDLRLANYNNSDTLFTGTADAAVKTDGYSGSITFDTRGGSAISKGLSLIDLQIEGTLQLACEDTKGRAAVSAGTVRLEGEDLFIRLNDGNAEFQYAIEATDAQNGEIRLNLNKQKRINTNKLELTQGVNVNVTVALFKAKNTYLTSNGGVAGRSDSIFLKSEAVAEGNLAINTVYDIEIKANTVADGDLTITGTNTTGYIRINSGQGPMVTGDITIEAENARTTLATTGGVVVQGNAKINARSLGMRSGDDTVIGGNAEIQTRSDMEITGAEGHAVIAGNTISMNALEGDINISRTGNNPTDTPSMLGGALQTRNIMVHYNDCGKQWLEIIETGKIYDAENCEHPIITGIGGRCAVCGDYDIPYAEVYGADGTLRLTLANTFGGDSAVNVIYDLQEGDTVKFTRDVYAYSMDVNLGNRILILDLNGHTLMTKNLSTDRNLKVKNGIYRGTIVNDRENEMSGVMFEDVIATLSNLEWKPVLGAQLQNSHVTVTGNDETGKCWLELLAMDHDSSLTLAQVPEGIGNHGYYSVDELLEASSLDKFLPNGYALVRLNTGAEERNAIVDADGNIATNIVLRYRQMTDSDMVITLDKTEYVYDGTAKKPAVTAVYAGEPLVEGTDYTVEYRSNTNAGTAKVIVEGKGAFHNSKELNFTIRKGMLKAPAGIKMTPVSRAGAKDGTIVNVSADMEYSTDQVTWMEITGTEITGLPAGDYYIRYKESRNYQASPVTKVTVTVKTAGTTTEAGSTTTESGGTTTETGSTTDDSDKTTATSENAAATTGTADTGAAGGSTSVSGTTGKGVATGDTAPLATTLILLFMVAGCAIVLGKGYRKQK